MTRATLARLGQGRAISVGIRKLGARARLHREETLHTDPFITIPSRTTPMSRIDPYKLQTIQSTYTWPTVLRLASFCTALEANFVKEECLKLRSLKNASYAKITPPSLPAALPDSFPCWGTSADRIASVPWRQNVSAQPAAKPRSYMSDNCSLDGWPGQRTE